jgi:hypothetical protein
MAHDYLKDKLKLHPKPTVIKPVIKTITPPKGKKK